MNIIFLKVGNGVSFREHLLSELISKINPAFAYIIDVNNPYSSGCPHNISYYNYLDIKNAAYVDIDWNNIEPLDQKYLESMSDVETEVLDMMEREVESPYTTSYFSNWNLDSNFNEASFAVNKFYKGELTFKERKLLYHKHLRFWTHFFKYNSITNLLYLDNAPHGALEFIIYNIAKRYNVKTTLLANTPIVNHSIIINDYKINDSAIKDLYNEILLAGDNIVFTSNDFIEEWKRLTTKSEVQSLPSYEYENLKKEKLAKVNYRKSVISKVLNFSAIKREIKYFSFDRIYYLFKLKNNDSFQKKLFEYYKRLSKTPDLTKSYIYVPLHFQPEMTTSPLGGKFVNQELMVEMLSYCVPKNTLIYVKEHRMQKYRNRNFLFYHHLSKLPNVNLIEPNFSTFKLMEHSIAVASVTGTAGWEGLFKGKPFLLFGYHIYQYAPFVYPIRSTKDCERAVEIICNNTLKIDSLKLRAFMKAIETKSFHWRRHKIDSSFEGDDVEFGILYNNLFKKLLNELK